MENEGGLLARYLTMARISNPRQRGGLINQSDPTLRNYFHKGKFNYGIKIHYLPESDYPITLP